MQVVNVVGASSYSWILRLPVKVLIHIFKNREVFSLTLTYFDSHKIDRAHSFSFIPM